MWGKRHGRLTKAVQEAEAEHERELAEARARKAQADRLTARTDRTVGKIRDATDAFTDAMAHALQGRAR